MELIYLSWIKRWSAAMEFFKNITIAYFKSLFELKLMSSFHNQNKITLITFELKKINVYWLRKKIWVSHWNQLKIMKYLYCAVVKAAATELRNETDLDTYPFRFGPHSCDLTTNPSRFLPQISSLRAFTSFLRTLTPNSYLKF